METARLTAGVFDRNRCSADVQGAEMKACLRSAAPVPCEEESRREGAVRWREGCAVLTACQEQVRAVRAARSGLLNQVVRPFMRSAIHDCTALSGHAAVRCPAFTDRGKMPLRICS